MQYNEYFDSAFERLKGRLKEYESISVCTIVSPDRKKALITILYSIIANQNVKKDKDWIFLSIHVDERIYVN